MPVGDVFRLQVLQNVGSELTMNILHARCTVSETVSPVQEALNVCQMAYNTYEAIAPELSEDWKVIAINCHNISAGGGVPANLVLGAAEGIAGGVESEIIPSTSAILFSFYTSTGDRTGRGRSYIPGGPESSQNEGHLLEARWAAIQALVSTAYVGEKGPFLGGDGKYRYIVHDGSGESSASFHILDVVVRPNLATQRRRRQHPGFGD